MYNKHTAEECNPQSLFWMIKSVLFEPLVYTLIIDVVLLMLGAVVHKAVTIPQTKASLVVLQNPTKSTTVRVLSSRRNLLLLFPIHHALLAYAAVIFGMIWSDKGIQAVVFVVISIR